MRPLASYFTVLEILLWHVSGKDSYTRSLVGAAGETISVLLPTKLTEIVEVTCHHFLFDRRKLALSSTILSSRPQRQVLEQTFPCLSFSTLEIWILGYSGIRIFRISDGRIVGSYDIQMCG